MKKQLLLFCTFLISTLSFSQTFNDGILEYIVTDAINNYVSVNKYNNTCVTGDITIPETIIDNSITYTITSIGASAFINCTSLTTITIPSSVTSIGTLAFRSCTSLTTIDIPLGVTSIEDGTFNGCSSLATITIPSSVVSIGSLAFRSCSSLTALDIPSGVTSIESGTFDGCSSLTNITIPSSVASIGPNVFRSCSSLTALDIPSGVTSIESGTFDGCSSLTNITIPSSVASIGSNAFRGCSSLTTIDLPSSITSIGSSAFRDCTGLTSFKVNWNTPLSITAAVFTNTPIGSIPLTVPTGTDTAYQAAAVWQDFGSIVLGLKDFNSNETLQLYPNPVKDVLNIKLDNGTKLNQVIIYNALGQSVNTSKNLKINTTDLKSGLYFIEVNTNKGKSAKRIVIE